MSTRRLAFFLKVLEDDPMAKIEFLKNRAPLEIPDDSNLRFVLLKNKVPLASSCGGAAVCSKCWVQVLKGNENLSAPSDDEKRLKETGNMAADCRLSCMVDVKGDILIDTKYW